MEVTNRAKLNRLPTSLSVAVLRVTAFLVDTEKMGEGENAASVAHCFIAYLPQDVVWYGY